MTTRRSAVVAVALAAVVLTGTGIAWASGITLTTKKLGASAVTTPAMFPVSVTLANKAGQIAGKLNNGDIITVVWSQVISAPTLCSGWSNTGTPSATNIQWSVTDHGTGNDTMAATGTSGTCSSSMHVGTIDLGAAGYNTNATAAIDFPNSSHALSYTATTTTLTITLGGQTHGTAGTVASGTAATLTPDSALTDRSGRNCGANLAKTTTTVQF